ncbi:MAG: hypothetical protein ACR2PO_03470, partial [Methyloligellaceae bacterium]
LPRDARDGGIRQTGELRNPRPRNRTFLEDLTQDEATIVAAQRVKGGAFMCLLAQSFFRRLWVTEPN